MNEITSINLPLEDICDYCAHQPIQRLSLFGSALHGELTVNSDIDLLVQYTLGARVGYLSRARQGIDLSQIIGRSVDLRTRHELSPYFRQQVIDSAQLIYEKE